MTSLPSFLQEKITNILQKVSLKQLEVAAANLSDNYRKQSEGIKAPIYMTTNLEKKAYLALRFPATYAAVLACLEKIEIMPDSVLDVGAGPGTASLAAQERFRGIKKFTLVEQDLELIHFAKDFLKETNASFIQQPLQKYKTDERYDLIIAAYSLSELKPNDLIPVILQLWKMTEKNLMIIEPGTPYGFNLIHTVREQLIQNKAYIRAPCTHTNVCPLYQKNDWCHFATRLERNHFQRYVKNATLGYEDEKYSYLIASKMAPENPYARIVKTPSKHSGHVSLTLCTATGLEEKIISKKDKALYKLARKANWGDPYPFKEDHE